MKIKDLITDKLNNAFPEAVKDICDFRDELTISIDCRKIIDICRLLKTDDELQFNYCEDVTAVDQGRKKNRFTVVYHLYSMEHQFRLRLKADLPAEEIDSISGLYPAANWHERETFDMFGIKFNNHPDLRRMYMPEEFEYNPLRKDFPLLGIPGSLSLPKK